MDAVKNDTHAPREYVSLLQVLRLGDTLQIESLRQQWQSSVTECEALRAALAGSHAATEQARVELAEAAAELALWRQHRCPAAPSAGSPLQHDAHRLQSEVLSLRMQLRSAQGEADMLRERASEQQSALEVSMKTHAPPTLTVYTDTRCGRGDATPPMRQNGRSWSVALPRWHGRSVPST